MNRRFYLVWALTILLISFASTMLAQAPAAAPKLSDDDHLLLQAVATVAQLANADCQGLDSVKKYQAQLSQVNTRMDAKYPGYTVDWTTGALKVKPAAAAK